MIYMKFSSRRIKAAGPVATSGRLVKTSSSALHPVLTAVRYNKVFKVHGDMKIGLNSTSRSHAETFGVKLGKKHPAAWSSCSNVFLQHGAGVVTLTMEDEDVLAVERRAFSRTGGLRGPSCPPRRLVSMTAVPVWDRQCLLSADFKVLDMSHSSPVPPRSDSVHFSRQGA